MRKSNLQAPQLNLSDFQDKSLLILDDDDPLRGRLSRAMEKKGFLVKEAKSVAEGLEIVKKSPPNFAVVDLRLEDGNGLDVIKELSKKKSDCRIVMLTGYGNTTGQLPGF
jgi:Response regulator consisting of a CheY-like receiver domain and a Fis-type HTH domain